MFTGVVAIVVSVAFLALVDAMTVLAGELSLGAGDAVLLALLLVRPVAAVVQTVATTVVFDTATIRAQKVLVRRASATGCTIVSNTINILHMYLSTCI